MFFHHLVKKLAEIICLYKTTSVEALFTPNQKIILVLLASRILAGQVSEPELVPLEVVKSTSVAQPI